MGNTNAKRDDNWQPVIMGETDDASRETRPLIVDPTTERLKVETTGTVSITETKPTDTTKINPSYVLTRNASGFITSIAQTIGATTYTKTITRDVNNLITDISVWV